MISDKKKTPQDFCGVFFVEVFSTTEFSQRASLYGRDWRGHS